MAKMMSASPSITQPRPSSVRTIPGGYGWPVLGPISDRLDYFWFQGPETFFRKRIEKNKSTVFRTNVPPTFPLFTRVNPNVIAVLDVKSFSHLFDMDVVEKADTLVGDFMPSVSFTGGLRVCAYLDTSEPKHSKIKGFAMDILRRSSATWVPTVLSKLDSMWSTIDTEFSSSSSANYIVPLQQCIFSFLSQCLVGADPSASPNIAAHGYAMLDLWLGLMLLPTVKIGFLQPLEEIFLHSFAYPSFLVSGGYNKLLKFVEEEGREVVERGEREFGLTRDEAVHNVLFVLGFNAYGGFSIFFLSLLGMLGSDMTVQEKLREEARAKGGPTLSFNSVKDMELVQSFVYETLRLSPPVPTQYGRARKDFLLSSHDSVFEIKKGELLCGYQPLVMRDPIVFDEPEKFVFDRFTKEKGSELLKYLYCNNYLYWSNGPQTGSPSESNKQCPAKDYVTVTASLFVAYLLRRYDSIACNSSGSITALVKAK